MERMKKEDDLYDGKISHLSTGKIHLYDGKMTQSRHISVGRVRLSPLIASALLAASGRRGGKRPPISGLSVPTTGTDWEALGGHEINRKICPLGMLRLLAFFLTKSFVKFRVR